MTQWTIRRTIQWTVLKIREVLHANRIGGNAVNVYFVRRCTCGGGVPSALEADDVDARSTFSFSWIIISNAHIVLSSHRLHYLACIDGCFTQKRRKTRGAHDDPAYLNPDHLFLNKDYVADMEKEVDEKRKKDGGKWKGKEKEKDLEKEKDMEKGMEVPTSVLDGCNASFTAADEKREKASTQFFADTGLMALVCRHDRVLWFTNMTSPGERQHYALALIRKFMEHLPPDATVGILYDIGCQLDRSFKKWDFLPEFRHRITFAISVFHAYGHQWPCQVIYHPRKCVGFGLTDGEGCERVWSSIRKLIAVLRVTGVRDTSLYDYLTPKLTIFFSITLG